MSLTLQGSITLTSSTLQDGTVDTTNNQLYVVESTGPSMRKYNLATLAQVGSNITTLAAPGGIALINSASSVVVSTTQTTVDFIENSSGYRTNVAGGATIYGTVKGQRIAGDTGNGVVLAVGSASNKLIKATTAQAVSQITLQGITNFVAHCIIFKSSGRFLVGGKFGKIYEVDTNGAIQDELTVTVEPNTGLLANYNNSALDFPIVNFMSYDNNILLASTEESLYCYDYSTKTKLWERQVNNNTGSDQITLCAASSGETLMGYNAATAGNNIVKEINFTTAPNQGDTLFTDTTSVVLCTGFSGGTSQGFALQGTTKIRVLSVSAPNTSLQTINLPSPYLNARLIVLDDTNGVGRIFRVLDTEVVTGGIYRLPAGRTLVGLIKMYNGTNAFWCESRVNT